MLVLEECRGWEYIAVRGLGTKRRFFASPPPDSSASFSRSWFRVLEFGKRCYSSYLFLLQCFLCLPSPTTLCSYKPWVEVDVFFLYFCVLCPPLQCCWILPDVNCRCLSFTLLTRWQKALEVPEIPAVSGRIPAFINIRKLAAFYPPRLLTHVLQREFKFCRNKQKKAGLLKEASQT